MKYLDWNQALYQYFFQTGSDSPVVLACNQRVLRSILPEEEQTDIEDEDDDSTESSPQTIFLRLVKTLTGAGVNIGQLNQPFENASILRKAKLLMDAWNEPSEYSKEKDGRLLRPAVFAKHPEPPYIGLLCSLSMAAFNEEAENGTNGVFWQRVTCSFGDVPANERGLIHDLFRDLKSKCPAFHSFHVHGHEHVGRIYSQTPFTKQDELWLKAWLLERDSDIEADDDERYQDVYQYLDDMLARFDSRTQRYWRNFTEVERDIMVRYVLRHWSELRQEGEEEKVFLEESAKSQPLASQKEKTIDLVCKPFILFGEQDAYRVRAIIVPENTVKLPYEGGTLAFTKVGDKTSNLTIDYGYQTVMLTESDGSKSRCRFLVVKGDESGRYRCNDKKLTVTLPEFPDFPLFVSKVETSSSQGMCLMVSESGEINQDFFLVSQEDHNDAILSKQEGALQLGQNHYNVYKLRLPENSVNELLGRRARHVSHNLQCEFSGVQLSRKSEKVFAENFPLVCRVVGADAVRLELFSTDDEHERLVGEFKVSDERGFDSSAMVSFSLGCLELGNFRVKLFDSNNTGLSPALESQLCFRIGGLKDYRKDPDAVQVFELSDADYLQRNYELAPQKVVESSLILTSDQIVRLIDAIIGAPDMRTPYSMSLRDVVIPAIAGDYIAVICAEKGVPFEDVTLAVAKEVFRVLGEMGIAERVDGQRFKMLKPFWAPSSVREGYILHGALTSSEREGLGKMTNLKSHQNSVHRLVKIRGHWLVLKLDMPAVFTCSTGKKSTLPAIGSSGDGIFEKIVFSSDASFVEETDSGSEVPVTLRISDNRAYVNFTVSGTQKIERFNWKSAKWEVITSNDQLNIWFRFAGKRLFRVTDQKSYNNYSEYHHFLFERDKGEPWKYSYFDSNKGRTACYVFIRRLQHVDFTDYQADGSDDFDRLKARLQQAITGSKQDLRNILTNAQCMDDLADDVNGMMQINLLARSLKNSLFVYDSENRVFGCLTSLPLPSNVERGLFLLSGRPAVNRKVETIDIEATLSKWHSQNQLQLSGYEKKHREYRTFFNVPKKVAQIIASRSVESVNLAVNPDIEPFLDVKF